MEKFSVKKPFTVLVGVIMIIALGIVSVSKVSTDLLPTFNLPYLMIVTPYPGASPERIEMTVTRPMENALGTVNGVHNVLSVSNENYCMLQLEFEDGTNLDSAMVKISGELDQLSGTLPDAVGTPSIIELSMDMLATMYVAVGKEGTDIYALSDFVRDDVRPYLERQMGVASVTSIGMVEKSVQVELNAEKIDELNERILKKTDQALADAQEQLDKAEKAVKKAQDLLDSQEEQFGDTLSDAIFSQVDNTTIDATNALIDQINLALDELNTLNAAAAAYTPPEIPADAALPDAASLPDGTSLPDGASLPELPTIPDLNSAADVEAARQQFEQAIAGLSAAAQSMANAADPALYSTALLGSIAQVQNSLQALSEADPTGQFNDLISDVSDSLYELGIGLGNIPSALSGLEDGYAGLTQAQLEAAIGFSTAKTQLQMAQAQLEAARTQFENSKEEALAQANADSLLSAATLSQLIYAQNFEMPVGYIDDKNNNSWLLRVGEEYDDAEEIAQTLLLDSKEIGTIRLTDVADITVIDNTNDSYANLNGGEGIMLAIYKSSTAGTNSVSRVCRTAFADLEERFPGTRIVPMMDQGVYITFIIKDILTSMLLGSLLAILVLALFLRTVRPTLVVAISIPLSVLFTLVLMFFTDLSLNMMTLSGLALGVGMLVDNSIVVMENIFRLRTRGLSAARASVQGARQVRSPILASTLTTICVFFPIAFASGTVRQFLSPLALTIGYCLGASLVVSLTVVPAATSTILRNSTGKEIPFFTRLQKRYGKSLSFCLHHKAAVLGLAVFLLLFSIWQILRMGIVFLPEMTSNYIEVDITTPNAETREESYALADDVIDRILPIEGKLDVGMMDQGSFAGIMAMGDTQSNDYGSYIGYITAPENTSPEEVNRICQEVRDATEDLDCTVRVFASSMADMSGFTSSGGLTLTVYGQELETLKEVAAHTKEIVEGIPGFKDVKDGTEEGAPTLQLHIDRDKAMRYGLTTAQIFTEIASRAETKVTSTSISVDGMELQVVLSDPTDPLTRENLLDMVFQVQTQELSAMAGAQGGSAGNTGLGLGGLEDLEDIDNMSDEEMLNAMFHASSAEETEENETEETEEKEEDEDALPKEILLRDIATLEETTSFPSIERENLTRYLTVTAGLEEGQNITLLSRELEPLIQAYEETLPRGYSISFAGQTSQINDMLEQMMKMLGLAVLFIYLIMVAQFQSLLSPFIVMFTIPLAFTGGMLGLLLTGQQLTLLSLMGFVILTGTVVNNGIVFVDYANQLRIGGLDRHQALVATGQTRMRPILMTALTTILAMGKLIFGSGMGSQLGQGMAIVIASGLIYATLMTLYIVPIIYDIFFRRSPLNVEIGDDLEDAPDDAAEYLRTLQSDETDP